MNKSILIEKLNKMKNKIMERNVLLLIAWFFGLQSMTASLSVFSGRAAGIALGFKYEEIDTGHKFITFLLIIVAFILNILGWGLDLRWSALAAGIIYLLSLFIPGASKIILIPAILCLLAFISMKKMGNKTLGNNDKATNNSESRNSNEQ